MNQLFNPFRSAIGAGLAAFLLALIALGILYYNGYWFSGAHIVKTSSITIEHGTNETQIFIDNRRKNNNSTGSQTTVTRILPGTHSILVAQDGYWPWLKEVVVEANDHVVVSPFFVSRSTDGSVVSRTDPQFTHYRTTLATVSLPSETDKKISPSGNVALWVEDSSIVVEWLGDENALPHYFCTEEFCERAFIAFVSSVEIRNVSFFPERDDVMIVASGDSVFAVELDQRGTQNFQPIYNGSSPQFASLGERMLVISDQEFIFEVTL